MKREAIILPAIDADGRALCPKRYNVASLLKIKETVGEYGWQSLYQCNPFAKGGTLFRDVYHYDILPTTMQVSIGVDFAYSTKARADWSVAVVIGHADGIFYVLDVVRVQEKAPDFIARVRLLQATYKSASTIAYIGGQEQGVIDTMRSVGGGFDIDARRATKDKFTRAQPVAAAWCAAKVLLPWEAPWLDAVVAEVVGFTGIGDRNDDIVDALSSAYDAEWQGGYQSFLSPEGQRGMRNYLGQGPAEDGPDVRWSLRRGTFSVQAQGPFSVYGGSGQCEWRIDDPTGPIAFPADASSEFRKAAESRRAEWFREERARVEAQQVSPS